MTDARQTTDGFLLDGRVRYAQPRHGFRTALEPVLLAAAVPASPGDRVLEAGAGAGAGLLCLSARLPGIEGLGIERDASLAALATENAAANGATGLRFLAAAIEAVPVGGIFDHAFANPPYHAGGGPPSPVLDRRRAKQAGPDLFLAWARCLGGRLRRRGTLTLALPAAHLPLGMEALSGADCPPVAVLPLWPRPGAAAKLLLLRGVKGGKEPFRLSAGLALHAARGYTPEAEAVLRNGAALVF